MKKEIIETEIERVFPQFNKAEIKASTKACEWMQERIAKRLRSSLCGICKNNSPWCGPTIECEQRKFYRKFILEK